MLQNCSNLELTINIHNLLVIHGTPMLAKNLVYFLSLTLILFVFASIGTVAAQTNPVSLEGAGVAITLSFPEDAHPNDSISHTIAANTTSSTSLEIMLFVYAPVDSTFQQIKSNTSSWATLPAGISLPAYSIRFTLPQNVNGTLRCVLYVRTNQLSDYMSFTFYTTLVRSVSYSELQIAYSELLANHSKLVIEYENLLEEYDGLRSENIGLISSQEALLKDYNEIKANYSSLLGSQTALQSEYNVKKTSYDGLLADFNSLTTNYNSLQGNYTSLESIVGNLKQAASTSEAALNTDRILMLVFIIAIVGLIALVAYVKRKKQEPYMVIREETPVVNKEDIQ